MNIPEILAVADTLEWWAGIPSQRQAAPGYTHLAERLRAAVKDTRPYDDHWHAAPEPDEREEKPPRDYLEYVLNLCRARGSQMLNRDIIAEADHVYGLRAAAPPMDKAVCKTCGGTHVVYPFAPDNYNQTGCPDCTIEPRDEHEADDVWIDAMYAFEAAVPSHQRGFCEWRDRMQAALKVLNRPAGPSREVLAEELERVAYEENPRDAVLALAARLRGGGK